MKTNDIVRASDGVKMRIIEIYPMWNTKFGMVPEQAKCEYDLHNMRGDFICKRTVFVPTSKLIEI
jgi:hypothetical protein